MPSRYVVLFVCAWIPGVAAAATTISGNVYDGQGGPLTPAGSPYVVPAFSTVTVPLGQTLTVQPGVEIRLDENAMWEVHGQLVAEGSAASPIRVRNHVGGTRWLFLVFRDGSRGALRYCELDGGGRSGNATVLVQIPDSLVMANTIVRGGGGDGLSGSIGGSNPGTLSVSDCVFDSNAGYGIQLTRGADATVDLSDNAMNSNAGAGYRLGPNLYPAGGTFAGNGFDGIDLVGGGTTLSGTYRHDLLINAQTTLTVMHPHTVILAAGISVHLQQNASIDVVGTLSAEGTASAHIRFRRRAPSTPWSTVYLRAGSIATFQYCDFEGGGHASSPMLLAQDPLLAIVDHSTFLLGASDGLAGTVGLGAPGTLEVTQCTFSGNAHDGLDLTRGTVGSVTLVDNVFLSNGSSAYHLSTDLYPVGGSADGNGYDGIVLKPGLVSHSGAYEHDLRLDAFGVLTVAAGRVLRLRPGITFRMMPSSYIEVYGALLAEGESWGRIRFTPQSTAATWQAVIARQGSSLTLRHCDLEYGASAMVVLQEPESALIEHCTVRSALADGIAGSIGVTVPGDLTLRNCTVSGNGSVGCRLVLGTLSDASVTCNAFTGNDYGLEVSGGAPVIRWNAFVGNTRAGFVLGGASDLDITENWWGHPSGPDSIGSGVGDNLHDNGAGSVFYAPWATSWNFSGCGGGSSFAPADLAVTQAAVPNVAAPGDSIQLVIVTRNNGPATSYGVTVRDSLSPGLRPLDVDDGACSIALGVVTCSFDSLPSGDSLTIVVTAAADSVGLNTATAVVAASSPDPTTHNDRVTTLVNVLASPTDPYVSSIRPGRVLQGAPRLLFVEGGNFVHGDTAFRVVLTRRDREPDPGEIVGTIVSATASMVLAEFDVTSPLVFGAWDVEVRNPGGASGHAPMVIAPSLIFGAMQQGGIAGIPILPEGQYRTNYVDVGMIGNDDGFVPVVVRPPAPGIIHAKIGTDWDSRFEEDKTRAFVLIQLRKRAIGRIPMHWGIPPERVFFPPVSAPSSVTSPESMRAMSHPGGPLLLQDEDELAFGSEHRITVDGLKGATKSQVVGMLTGALVDAVCGGIADALSGNNRSYAEIAVNSVIEDLPQNWSGVPKYIFDQVADELMDLVPGYSWLSMVADCSKELSDAFFGRIDQESKAAVDRLRAAMGGPDNNIVVETYQEMQGNAYQTHFINRVVNMDGGVLDQLQGQPCSPYGTRDSLGARIRGPWDPNAKYSLGTHVPIQEAFGDTTREVLLIPATRAHEPIVYRIAFENRPQATDSATIVTIRDTLDGSLDPSTVECDSAASMAARGSLDWSVTGNVLTVTYDGIKLPPNLTAPEGEWQFCFSVRPFLGLPVGAEIRNRASIVFDFNPAILTPEVLHRIGAPEIAATPSANLGDVFVGQSQTATLWLYNAGDYPLDVFHVSGLASPFSVVADSCTGESLASGDSCGITVSFAPAGVGAFDDTVAVASSDVNRFPLHVLVQGTGQQPQSSAGRIPGTFALHPCHPNPVRRVALIRYDLPRTGRVSLRVFDVLGRRVATLVDRLEAAGSKEVLFDASRLPSGLYYYRLEAEGRSSVKHLVKIR